MITLTKSYSKQYTNLYRACSTLQKFEQGMKFTKEMLLPRITRQQNPKLERFIVSNISKELAKIKNKDYHYDLVQMQYFLESVFSGL